MKHAKKLLIFAAAAAGAAGLATAGWAYWSAGGSGTASATVGTLNAPTNVTVPTGPIASPVSISWTAPTGGVAPTGYIVERFAGATLDGPACNSSAAAPLPATPTSCTDTDLADGAYTYRVTAVFASWTAVSAPSGSVTVSNIGPASKIILSGSIADLASGTTRVFTATIQDAAGHTITTGSDSSHSITFSQSSGIGSVSGLGSVTASNGVATITVTGNLAGPMTAQAAAAFAGGAVTSNSLDFTVVHGAASQLALSGSTNNLASGVTRVLSATVKDAAGNTVTTGSDAARSITFTQTGGTGSVGGISGGIPATAGVSTITVTGYAAGPVTTQASTTLTAGPAQSNTLSFDVTVGAATRLVFTNQPGSSTGGIPLPMQPKVTVQDFGGNTVTTDTGAVSVAIGTNLAGGTLSGSITVNAVNGLATFSGLSIDKSGSGYTLTASRSGLTPGTSSAFDIAVGPAAQMAFSTQPSSTTTGGTAFATQPQVTVRDAGGNPVSSASVALAVTSGSGGGAGGTLTCTTNPATTNGSGVAAFAGCSINTKSATPYALTATSGTLNATSTGITVSTGPAAKLVVTTSPSNATAGTSFATQPKVTVQDAGGNTVTTDASTVTLTITAGTPATGGPGTLSGCTQSEVAGVVSFAGCKIDAVGTGYKIHAAAGSLSAADSATFNVYGNVAGLVFSNVKVNGTSVTPTCTGTIGSTYTCSTTGANNSTLTANVVFANASGTATAYSSENQSIGWTTTGKTPDSGTLTINGSQTTSNATASAQMNGSNSAAITVTFTSWSGQTWTATLSVAR